MLYWFVDAAPGYSKWLATHSEDFVVTVDRVFRSADRPPTGGFPAAHDTEPLHRILHRATCETIGALGRGHSRICGPRRELVDSFEGDVIERCRACL